MIPSAWRRFAGAAAVLLSAVLLPVLAASAEEEGPVQAVRIEGLRTVGEAYIRSRVQTVPGAPLSESVLDQDIGRLYQTGYFAQVKVRREAVPGGVVVVIEVEENPLVGEVVFRGHKAFSEAKLKDRIRTWVDKDRGEVRYVERADLDLDVKSLVAAYREKAYLFARVTARLEPAGDAGERLVFEVDEGVPVPVRKIAYRGNRSYDDWQGSHSLGKLRKGAPVLTKTKWWFFRAGALDLEVLQDDADRIRDFYRAHGWLDAKVKASHQMDLARRRTEVAFDIEEGERYMVGTVALTGNTLLDATSLLPRFRTQSGKPLRLEDVEHDEDAIRGAYGDLGHVVAQAVPRYHYDAIGKTVDLTFEIREGPKVRIRRVEVEGNVQTRDKIIRREMRVHPGDLFNYSEIKRSQKRIRGLRYFKEIQLRLDETGDEAERDLIVKVEEDKTGSINYGAGYSDESGVFGILRINQRNFDSADLRGFPFNTKDFFLGDAYVGGGQDLTLSATPGQRITSYDIGYAEPWLYDRPYGLGLNFYLRSRDLIDFVRNDKGASVNVNRRFGDYWKVGNLLSFTTVRISDVALDAPQTLRDSEGTTTLNSTTPYLVYDSRDDPYTPSVGRFNRLSFEYGGAPILDGVDFMRFGNDYYQYWTLSQNEDEERKHILSFGVRAGVVVAHSETSTIPVFMRYFAGGSTSVRGFGFNAIGPKEGDTVVGGRFLLLTNLEYTFPIYEEILRGAAFIDRGTVEERLGGGNAFDEFRSSYGIGLRVHLPINPVPVALDLAFPIEQENGDSLRAFTFSFGGVF